MKSPERLKRKLAQEWQKEAHRVARLCDAAWPVRLAIGLPKAEDIGTPALREHLAAWQRLENDGIGSVVWQRRKYRACAGEIDCPSHWQLNTPADWQAAMDDAEARDELGWFLEWLAHEDWQRHVAEVPQQAREQLAILLRHKALVLPYAPQTMWQLLILAHMLEENIAQGLPLRALSWQHIVRHSAQHLAPWQVQLMQTLSLDSKFFERHQSLLGKLLAQRFGERVTQAGFAAFLGAESSGGWIRLHENGNPRQWLPFPHIRIPAADLRPEAIPFANILIIENEQCLHLLPPLADTLIILGAGRNLGWLEGAAWQHKRLYYWGDLDSWGMAILGNAQACQPHLVPLMMDSVTFARHREHAVTESGSYSQCPPALDHEQAALFAFLRDNALRLEQEFIDRQWVAEHCRQYGLV